MIKDGLKKALSVLVSAAMLSGMPVTFAAESSTTAAAAKNVLTFTEDFTSYTADDVSTSYVTMTADKAGAVAATHPSGAKWLVSTTDEGRGKINDTMYAKYRFDVDNDRLYVQGMAWKRAALNLDMSAVNKVKKFKTFTFTTLSQRETEGARLFVNNSENTYIEFSMAGYRDCGIEKGSTNGPVPAYQPKVVFSNNGARTVLFNSGDAVTVGEEETTRGLADGWTAIEEEKRYAQKYVKWDITLNDDGTLSWSVTPVAGGEYAAGAAKSSGTVSADIVAAALADYKYPIAITGDGDDNHAYTENVSFTYVPDYSVSFTDDFSSYTADDVSTSYVTMTADKAGAVAATHPSGAKWLVSTTDEGRGKIGTNYASYKFDVDNNRLYMRGMAWKRAALNLDMSAVGNVKSFETFTFTTSSQMDTEGVRLFVNSGENTYIEFSMAGYRDCAIEKDSTNGPVPAYQPKVVFSNNGARTVLFNAGDAVTADGEETTRGLADGWTKTGTYDTKYVKWNVTMNDDGTLGWSVTSVGGSYQAGAAKSSGTISADIVAAALADYTYPLAVTGDGDHNEAYTENVSFTYVPDNSLTFTEDFTSYTADDVATSTVMLTSSDSERVIATHPSGVTWKAPKTSAARGNDHAWYRFDVGENNLHLHGYGGIYRSSLNLDTEKALGIKKINEFSFTVMSIYETGGARLFVSDDEKSYLEFAVPGDRNTGTEKGAVPADMPKVVYSDNGTRTILFNSGAEATADDGSTTTQGLKDGWKAAANRWQKKQVKWDIVINDDNSVTWTATSVGGIYTAGEAVSTGTISAEIAAPLIENYRYPFAFDADGDMSEHSSYISRVSFKYEPDKEFKAPTFSDDFSGYTDDGSTVTESFKIQNNKKVLGTNAKGAKWITSNKNSYGTYSDYAGRAYIDIAKNKLATVGWGQWHVQRVLLDYSDKKYDIDKVKFSSEMGSGRMTGLSMFVDGKDENNYLFFGQMTSQSTVYGINATNQPYAPLIVKSVNGVATVLEMTEQSEGTSWNLNDSALDWTIEFDDDCNITWSVKSGRGTTASGTIAADDDIKAIINSNWAYPIAATATGDDFSYITSVDMWTSNEESVEYEKKAYTRDEFKALYKNAEYGKAEEVEKLMQLDLGSVSNGTATAEVNVGTSSRNITTAFLGTHTEYNTGYSGLADADGSLTDEYIAAAESISPIAAYRLGGGGTTSKNMLKDLQNEDSYYLSADELPEHMQEKAGTISNTHTGADFVTLINAALANNPNASFNLCISPYTTTPAEVSQLISLLTGPDSDSRRIYGLPEKALKIEYIELGNELEHFITDGESDYDKSKTFATWYGNRMPDYISVIEEADPSIKIIANGMTCPWLGTGSYGFWLDMLAAARTVGSDTSYKIIDHIDLISFHPYNSNSFSSPTGVLSVGDAMKSYLDNIAPGNNVKFCVTEYGIAWRDRDSTFDTHETYSLKSALLNATFIAEAAQKDSIDHSAMFAHCTMGNLWARVKNNIVTPLGAMYSFLTDEWLNNVYNTTVTVTDADGVAGSYDNQFTVLAMKDSGSTMRFIAINAAAYKDVEATFNIPSGYTLVNEKVFTAPNIYSSAYDESCANIASVTSNDVEVENFSTYTVPAKSIVSLTLRAEDGKTEFAESFDYNDTSVTASEEAQTLAANENGAKWLTSATNNGFVAGDGEDYNDSYGTVAISRNALVISNDIASIYGDETLPTAANWDVSGISENLSGISEISFTITGENGGVKLFTAADESSKFNFSNKEIGLSGTVKWNLLIADGTLTWTATSGADTQTGTIAVSDDDMTGYTYLASAYLNGGVADSAAFDDFAVRYGAASEEPVLKGMEYVNNTSTVDVTVNPSVYGKTSARVYVGYYTSSGKLVGVKTMLATQDGDVLNAEKPDSYDSAKIFVWDTTAQLPLAAAAVVE